MALDQMKKLVAPKTEGPKKYVSKPLEVEIKGETSWGGESPEKLRNKLGKQLLKTKLEERALREKVESGKGDWMDKKNLKSSQEIIESTRQQLKNK